MSCIEFYGRFSRISGINKGVLQLLLKVNFENIKQINDFYFMQSIWYTYILNNWAFLKFIYGWFCNLHILSF